MWLKYTFDETDNSDIHKGSEEHNVITSSIEPVHASPEVSYQYQMLKIRSQIVTSKISINEHIIEGSSDKLPIQSNYNIKYNLNKPDIYNPDATYNTVKGYKKLLLLQNPSLVEMIFTLSVEGPYSLLDETAIESDAKDTTTSSLTATNKTLVFTVNGIKTLTNSLNKTSKKKLPKQILIKLQPNVRTCVHTLVALIIQALVLSLYLSLYHSINSSGVPVTQSVFHTLSPLPAVAYHQQVLRTH
jgi:hypothetical protein